MNDAREFEKTFSYGEGILPTPRGWIDRFWQRFEQQNLTVVEAHVRDARRVLFVGVGLADLPAKLGPRERFVGVDLNHEFLPQASRHCQAVQGDAAALPFADGSFDAVVCPMVLHHLVGQGVLEQALAECARVLAPGGTWLTIEPNLFHPSGLALNALNAFQLYHRVAGGSDHEFALSPFRLRRIARGLFQDVRVGAMSFSHPRFPPALQRALDGATGRLRRLYPLSFCFWMSGAR